MENCYLHGAESHGGDCEASLTSVGGSDYTSNARSRKTCDAIVKRSIVMTKCGKRFESVWENSQ